MTRDEIALQIFLKRLPSERLTATTQRGFQSVVEQAFEIADLYIEKQSELNMASIRKEKK